MKKHEQKAMCFAMGKEIYIKDQMLKLAEINSAYWSTDHFDSVVSFIFVMKCTLTLSTGQAIDFL